MKKIILILPVFLFISCIDFYRTKTKVYADGTIERTIEIKGDSSSIFNGNFKIPNDSIWKTTLSYEFKDPGNKKSEKIHTFKGDKFFKNAAELNEFLRVNRDSSDINFSEVEFKKRFRFFFTSIYFSEKYNKTFLYEYFPIHDFLTDYELGFIYDDDFTYNPTNDSLVHIKDLDYLPYLSPQDSIRLKELSDSIQNKWLLWESKNVNEDFFVLLEDVFKSDKKKLKEIKEYRANTKISDTLFFPYIFLNDNDEYMDSVLSYFGINEKELKELNPEKYERFEHKLASCPSLRESSKMFNSMELPGILVATNADSISGSETYWSYHEQMFSAEDFLMYTETRIVNKWMITILGIVSLSLLIVIIFRLSRKSKELRTIT